jgi:hypothetical protein
VSRGSAIFQILGAAKPARSRFALAPRRKTLSPSAFKRYQREIDNTRAFLKGFSDAVKAAQYSQDVKKWVDDPRNGWHDLAKDGAKDGFEYVLKRVSSKAYTIYEGPVGWFASVTLESSSTQTPAQDFDPMHVIDDPGQFSFDQRVAALQKLYESEARHPEVWNNSKRRWLYYLTEQIYNSPDNPNIHLVPQ